MLLSASLGFFTYYHLSISLGPTVNLSLMEPTLGADDKPDSTLLGQGSDDDDAKAKELLKVELVLNVLSKEEGKDTSMH